MAEKWLDEVHDAGIRVRDVSYGLEDLAAALQRIGFVDVSEELRVAAILIREADKQIIGAIGEMLSNQAQAGRESAALCMSVALTGMSKEADAYVAGMESHRKERNVE